MGFINEKSCLINAVGLFRLHDISSYVDGGPLITDRVTKKYRLTVTDWPKD